MKPLRDRGGYTIAEGCMSAAVVVFVLLMIGMLIVAFFRFREPPAAELGPVGTRPPVESRVG